MAEQKRVVGVASKIYSPLVTVGGWLQPVVLLGVRFLWGAAFIIAGWGKLHHLDKVTDFFASLHIPAPHAQATFVACVEFFGGILISLGLGTRLAAIFLAGAMLGAIHFSDHIALFPPHKAPVAVAADSQNTTEETDAPPAIFGDPGSVVGVKPVSYLAVSLLLLVLGPGAVSCDALIRKFWGTPARATEKTA